MYYLASPVTVTISKTIAVTAAASIAIGIEHDALKNNKTQQNWTGHNNMKHIQHSKTQV